MGIRKANAPLHVQMCLSDHTVQLVNTTRNAAQEVSDLPLEINGYMRQITSFATLAPGVRSGPYGAVTSASVRLKLRRFSRIPTSRNTAAPLRASCWAFPIRQRARRQLQLPSTRMPSPSMSRMTSSSPTS